MQNENKMKHFNPAIEDSPINEIEYPASMSSIIFPSDGSKLIGTIFLAAGLGPHPTVLLLHGFPGNELNHDIAHAIRRYGFNVIVFHYRGSWGSSGNFSFMNGLEDVSSAIEFLSTGKAEIHYRIDSTKIVLIGHSFGGFATLLASAKYNDILNIASLAGFNFGYFAKFIEENENFKEATLDGLNAGTQILNSVKPEILYNEILANQNEWNLLNLNNVLKGKNILLVGAEYDTVSPPDIHHIPLVKSLSKSANKIEEVVLKSGHSFSCCRIELTQLVIDWIQNIKF